MSYDGAPPAYSFSYPRPACLCIERWALCAAFSERPHGCDPICCACTRAGGGGEGASSSSRAAGGAGAPPAPPAYRSARAVPFSGITQPHAARLLLKRELGLGDMPCFTK